MIFSGSPGEALLYVLGGKLFCNKWFNAFSITQKAVIERMACKTKGGAKSAAKPKSDAKPKKK